MPSGKAGVDAPSAKFVPGVEGTGVVGPALDSSKSTSKLRSH